MALPAMEDITWQQLEAWLMATQQEMDDISQLALLACGRTTAWGSTWSSTLPRTMHKLIEAQRLKFQARLACPEPERGWTESQPLCSSPLCNAKTGLWLPSRKEVEDADGYLEFSCGTSVSGSVSIRSMVAKGNGPFVACCRDCGMLLKQMIRIRETHESVLLASRRRVAPQPARLVGLPPSEFRLLSEMSESSGPSVPRSRSV